MNDLDGFNFTISGQIGRPPYVVTTTDGAHYLLPDSVVVRQGETHRQCFDRNLADGNLVPMGGK